MTMSGYAKLGAVMAALALASCGGDANKATDTDGGTGAGGNGGSSGSCNIPCFANLFAACMPQGTCTFQMGNVCFSNGVKWITAADQTGTTTTYYKANGQVCFTGTGAFDGRNVVTTYKDANGVTAATGTFEAGSGNQTIMCNGKSYDLATECPAVDSSSPSSGGSCQPGTCM